MKTNGFPANAAHSNTGGSDGSDGTPQRSSTDAMTHACQEFVNASTRFATLTGNPKVRTLRAWIPTHLDLVTQLLRTQTRQSSLILPLVNALGTLHRTPEFDTDPINWFAANAGFSLKEAHQVAKASQWLYKPSAWPMPEDNSRNRTNQVKATQARVRDLLWEYAVPLGGIHMLRVETSFLDPKAKHLTASIITTALETTGHYPAVTQLQRITRRLVNKVNREYHRVTPGMEHTRIAFSRPDGNGMVLFQGRCTAQQATILKNTILQVREKHPQLIDHKLGRQAQDFQAFYHLATTLSMVNSGTTVADAPPNSSSGNGALLPRTRIKDVTPVPGVNYSVGVVLTANELKQLQDNPNIDRLIRTSEDEVIAWQQIRTAKLSPLDWIAVINETGITVKVDTDTSARFASDHQRLLASLRAPYCAHPGCAIPAARCQAHHVIAYKNGGKTIQRNIVLVCAHHHPFNDDTHERAGQFHYDLDENLIPYKQQQAPPGAPQPPREYNQLNLKHSPVLKALNFPARE